jgi:tricorn protease
MKNPTRLIASLVLLSPPAMAGESSPTWLRQPTVSPDGKHIAFTYAGQLWRVPADGGEAVSLTSALFRAGNPVWSPDSQSIAFSANRHGNPDVFVMPATGGEVKRLTTHSSADTPSAFTPDGTSVLFSSMRLGDGRADFGGILAGASQQLYSIPSNGGRERLVIPLPALEASPSPDGRLILYTNLRAPENEWRKHAVSDATRDIWIYDTKEKTHRPFTDWRGEDRDATWSADGKTVFWLSERSGSFNVWKQSLETGAKPEQVTFHKKHPVRFLSISRANDLVYGFDGELWKLPPGAKEPVKVAVHISQGSLLDGPTFINMNAEASEVAVSSDGTQLAVIARGEVFVIESASGNTRRVTNTPQHERNLSFRPDGKALLYAAERDGRYDAYESLPAAADATSFFSPGGLKEIRLTDTTTDVTEPAYSPDGTRIAYLEDRTQLVVMNLVTKAAATVMPKGLSYSYNDGDLPFVWSPDGRWLAATTGSATSQFDIHLIDASGERPPHNLTQSGFDEMGPLFSSDGKTLYFLTTRNGLRTTDAKAAQADVYAVYLTQAAYDAAMHPDEKPAAEDKDWLPDLDNLENRTVRLTPFSSQLAMYHPTPDGKSLAFAAVSPASGMSGYKMPIGKPGLAPLFTKMPPSADSFATDATGNLHFLGAAGIERINLVTGEASIIPFNAEVAYDLPGEMRWFFAHVHRMTAQKFYRADMGGVDWDFYGKSYARHLPSIRRGEDLAEMLSEMAGELNASHMGSAYTPVVTGGDQTASLGLYYDHAHGGPGVKITDYLETGPAGRAGSQLRPGAVILAVDGQTIAADQDIHELLNRRAGRPLRLTLQPAGGGAAVEETITPQPFVNSIVQSHDRWVRQREILTDRLSESRIGYIHIAGMDTANYQKFVTRAFGKFSDREALLIDVRFNTGGNLTDRLIADLSAKSAGKSIGREGNVLSDVPSDRWTKPSIVLANAFSYSDGSIFPHLYKDAKLGRFVGEPVPGTGTSVWWMELLPGGRLKYGIPEIGRKSPDGRFFENTEDVPDIIVYRHPDAVEEGRDEQLEAAAADLLKQLGDP